MHQNTLQQEPNAILGKEEGIKTLKTYQKLTGIQKKSFKNTRGLRFLWCEPALKRIPHILNWHRT